MAYTTINKSTDYFNTKLYTGTGSSNAVTGVGFQPDWTWIKERAGAADHFLFDAVRGVTNSIRSDQGSATYTNAQLLTAFGTDGFTVGTDGNVNGNGSTFAAWNWKANGQGSSNTDGSINTTYTSVNTTSGFSISTYTGTGSNATVGHGLGVAPSVMIVKNLTNANSWSVYHKGLNGGVTPQNYFLHLNETDTAAANASTWNNTAPTSSVFSIGTNNNTGGSYNYVAYCFAEKQGFSKFGSYVGNGEPGNDAPFIYTGFKPAFVLLKSSTYAESWSITDNRRLGYNGSSAFLKADASQAEATDLPNPEFLSNGFKLQTNDNVYNKNTQSYIYMAFAEAPLVATNGQPATAR